MKTGTLCQQPELADEWIQADINREFCNLKVKSNKDKIPKLHSAEDATSTTAQFQFSKEETSTPKTKASLSHIATTTPLTFHTTQSAKLKAKIH